MLSSLTKGVVCHMKERPGFSTEKYFCNSKHNWIKSQVISYNLLAAATRMAKVPDRVGSPLGILVCADDGGIPSSFALDQAGSGTSATWRREMYIAALWRSDQILYKFEVFLVGQIVFNYWTSQGLRQFQVYPKTVLQSHGSN